MSRTLSEVKILVERECLTVIVVKFLPVKVVLTVIVEWKSCLTVIVCVEVLTVIVKRKSFLNVIVCVKELTGVDIKVRLEVL